MKIAIDYGHNCHPDTGCFGLYPKYPYEDVLTKTLGEKVIALLKDKGHTPIDVVPKSCSSIRDSLKQRVQKANEAKADLYVSLHFNCFNKKVRGTETYYYPPLSAHSPGQVYAEDILAELVRLGFPSRGARPSDSYYVLKYTAMPAVLVEVCFCDSHADMELYEHDPAAEAIVRGIETGAARLTLHP